MNPIERIDQAFLQLEFAIKLMNYVELGRLNKDEFDLYTLIKLERKNIRFGDNTFHTYKELKNAAINNYLITLGMSVITLETSLQDAGIYNDLYDFSSKGQLRALVYMIRCAFAHDMMTPCWKVDSRYQRIIELNLGGGKISIDLCKLNGMAFEDSHIGGIETYYEIKNAVKLLIEA